MSSLPGPSWSVDNPPSSSSYGNKPKGHPASPGPPLNMSPRHSSSHPNSPDSSPKHARKKQPSGTEKASDTPNWQYHLEIIQQPQRARACGFGDKDRRPLTPPPIIRLWVRARDGKMVDPNLVNINFLILTVDLWSGDGTAERNIVMHPAAQGLRLISETSDYPGGGQSTSCPGSASSRPQSAHEATSIPKWGKTEYQTSYFPSNYQLNDSRQGEPLSPWERPGVARTQSYEHDHRDSVRRPSRPFTAPSHHNPHSVHLPPLSTISESPHTLHSHLPSAHQRPTSPPPPSQLNSWPTRESYESDPRPSSSRSDRPRTTSSSRPSTAGPLVSPHSALYASESSYGGLPRTPDVPRLQLMTSPPVFTRVLVGSLTSICMRLQDDQGEPGLYFFAHDLGIRTEGTFTLKFTLVDLSLLMSPDAVPGENSRSLAQIYSDPFTVYSAKRFPGVVPTTELTRHFAGQNVRLPTRQKRLRDDSHSEGEEE